VGRVRINLFLIKKNVLIPVTVVHVKMLFFFQAFSNFPELKKALSLHLVEISEKLSEMQEEKLSAGGDNSTIACSENDPHYKSCKSKHGPNVYWYRDVSEIPAGYTMFVAHEFFDALPIHKFQVSKSSFSIILVL
jgi:NADH dehydrogenase [ubiquinone] 1 alpha subcomplex assembly factor 7